MLANKVIRCKVIYMKKILLIGGTGIVGSAVATLASNSGYKIDTIGLTINRELSKKICQYTYNRLNIKNLVRSTKNLRLKNKRWDIVFDIIGSNKKDVQQTVELFSDARLIFLSTTLVYSRNEENDSPLLCDHPLASLGEMGGYVDKKIEMENYIRTQTLPWTILRPYHIVGPGSLLGCIPDHNRDPELVARLKRGEALELCNGGDIDFNIVHPADIGRAVLAVAENPATIHKAYNCVNPEPVKARDYYAEIARQVGGTLKIKTKS